jgi:hypothetical protein
MALYLAGLQLMSLKEKSRLLVQGIFTLEDSTLYVNIMRLTYLLER